MLLSKDPYIIFENKKLEVVGISRNNKTISYIKDTEVITKKIENNTIVYVENNE